MVLLIEAATQEAKEVPVVELSQLLADGLYRLPTPEEQNRYTQAKRKKMLLYEQEDIDYGRN